MKTVAGFIKKDFDSVEMMRAIRNKIDNDISKLTIEEQLLYYKTKSNEFRKKAGI